MLNRLETIYLSILRVFILIAASIALIVAAVAIVSAIPLIAQKAGWAPASGDNGSLADFMTEKRQSGSPSSGQPEKSSPLESQRTNLTAAARNVQDYLGKRSSWPIIYWEELFAEYVDQLPPEDGGAYAQSVKTLTEELRSSTGTPFSENGVEELLHWHGGKFLAELNNRQVATAEADARILIVAGSAISAFLVFVFIVFIFIFVKIERNLRLVRTIDEARTQGEAAAHA